jgi:hypothetical protein
MTRSTWHLLEHARVPVANGIVRTILLFVVAIFLAGCQTSGAASIRGACDSFEAPTFPVKGKARRDQLWIDGTTEAGVSACRWARPK